MCIRDSNELEKTCGLIVDSVGLFKHLQKTINIYNYLARENTEEIRKDLKNAFKDSKENLKVLSKNISSIRTKLKELYDMDIDWIKDNLRSDPEVIPYIKEKVGLISLLFGRDDNATKLIAIIKKRIEKIPLQYIVGKVDFYKYNFFVEKEVFIPRPETEILVGKAIEIYKRFFDLLPVDILDIGTGCGNIGISLALEIEKARVFATDVSEKALKVAEKNSCKYNIENKIKFIKSYRGLIRVQSYFQIIHVLSLIHI